MDTTNTPGAVSVLYKYQLTEIPEAHTYSEINGVIEDITGLTASETSFHDTLLHYEEIQPEQIRIYKTSYHKKFISPWIKTSKYSAEEI